MKLEIRTINAAFAMWLPILPSYGRQVDGNVVKIWLKVLDDAEVTDEEFQWATPKILETLSEFPTPSHVIKLVKAKRQSMGYLANFELPQEAEKRRREFEDQKALEAGEQDIQALRARYSHLRNEPDQGAQRPAARQEKVGFRQPTQAEIEETERKRREQIERLKDGAR